MASTSESPARFTPLQRASKNRRVLVFLLGPVLWLFALILVGIAVDRLNVVGFGMKVMLAALLVGLVISLIARRRRVSEERKAEKP